MGHITIHSHTFNMATRCLLLLCVIAATHAATLNKLNTKKTNATILKTKREPCSSQEFSCPERCVQASWHCDGEDDCYNGFDEADCAVDCTNNPNQFQCGHGQCIPASWKCDGDPDCGDSTDEAGCPAKQCAQWEFTCANNNCVDASFQ